MSADLLIDNTNFSIKFVLDKLRPSGAPETSGGANLLADLERFEANDATDGSAFMSTILRLRLHWKPNRSELPQSVVMKIPGQKYSEMSKLGKSSEHAQQVDDEVETQMAEGALNFLIDAHLREIAFYQQFPLHEPALKLPTFFFGSPYSRHNRDGLIIMEDLTARGVTMPVLPGFNEAKVLALLDEIAKLHAASWRHPEWTQCGTLVGNNWQMGEDIRAGMRQKALELKQIDPVQFDVLVYRILPFFDDEQYCEMAIYSGNKYGFSCSVVHGDIWAANVLWERGADGATPSDRLCAVIDWQTVHAGNPCEDIARILALNTGGHYRRGNTPRLLAHYAQRVAHWMGSNVVMPFTMEQLIEAYKHALPWTMMWMCFGVPMYLHMDSVVGKEEKQRALNQRELLQRARMLLEDTATAFGV